MTTAHSAGGEARSGCCRSPTLFVNGARFDGPLAAAAVAAALHA